MQPDGKPPPNDSAMSIELGETAKGDAMGRVPANHTSASYLDGADNDGDEAPSSSGLKPQPLAFLQPYASARQQLLTRAGRHSSAISYALVVLLFALWSVYVLYAVWHSGVDACLPIIVITGVVFAIVLVVYVLVPLGDRLGLWAALGDCIRPMGKHSLALRWSITALVGIGLMVFVVFDALDDLRRLQSLIGIGALIAIAFLCSRHPSYVPWNTVIWGFLLQLIFGIAVLRWPAGRAFFEFLGKCVTTLLEFTDAGVEFVFGEEAGHHFFAFKIMPIIIFFAFLTAAAFHVGLLQFITRAIGWTLYKAIGTTACESMVAGSNIFLGQTEAPLLIRPYIHKMTKSELHAVISCGFATIAGSLLGVFISFGINGAHLLSACLLSAPAALAMAKLFYPETEVSQTNFDTIKFEPSESKNVIEAAFSGAMKSIKIIGYIIAALVAALSALRMINWALAYLGVLVGVDNLSVELILGFVLTPLAWAMGADFEDAAAVGNLIGIKTILNEFIAYQRLGELIEASAISDRSQVVATYALCGFANFGSVGIMIGGLSAMAPNRQSDISALVVRGLAAGSFACFTTACVASLLTSGPIRTVIDSA